MCSPVSRAKTILQNTSRCINTSKNNRSQSHNNRIEKASLSAKNPSTLYQLLSAIYQEQGLSGLYNGLQVTILNGVLREAVMLMVKERVDIAVRLAFGVSV